MRCYLEAVGILKDDELNREKANELAFATAEDTLEECEKEVTGKFWDLHALLLCNCIISIQIVFNFRQNESMRKGLLPHQMRYDAQHRRYANCQQLMKWSDISF